MAFSVRLSLPLSVYLSVEVPGVWRGNGSGNLHQIFRVDRPTQRTRAFALFKGGRRILHVARADAQGLQKICPSPYRSNERHRRFQTCRSHKFTTTTCYPNYLNLCVLWLPFLWGARCTHQGRKTSLTSGLRMQGNFELCREAILGRLVDLGMDYLAPYDLMGWSAVCTCVFCTVCSFTALTGQTKRIAGPKLAGHTYSTPICVFFLVPLLSGAGCTRQDRKTLFERVLRF